VSQTPTPPSEPGVGPRGGPGVEPAGDPGRVYRSKRRPGLTSAGVAVFGTAVGLVAALVSVLLTDGLGWIFAAPFVLVSTYCAWEVRRDSLRAALIMPPLVLLLVVLLTPWVNGDAGGVRDGIVHTLTLLTKLAPALLAAEGVSGAILAWRRWGPGNR